jgi:hypothetical protein
MRAKVGDKVPLMERLVKSAQKFLSMILPQQFLEPEPSVSRIPRHDPTIARISKEPPDMLILAKPVLVDGGLSPNQEFFAF